MKFPDFSTDWSDDVVNLGRHFRWTLGVQLCIKKKFFPNIIKKNKIEIPNKPTPHIQYRPVESVGTAAKPTMTYSRVFQAKEGDLFYEYRQYNCNKKDDYYTRFKIKPR